MEYHTVNTVSSAWYKNMSDAVYAQRLLLWSQDMEIISQFPVTSKKMLLFLFCFFLFYLFIFYHFFFKKFTFSKPSESSFWGREVLWLDFPSSALELWAKTQFSDHVSYSKLTFSVSTETLQCFLSAVFHFFPQFLFCHPWEGVYIYIYIHVYVRMRKCNVKKNPRKQTFPSLFECALPHVQHVRLNSY